MDAGTISRVLLRDAVAPLSRRQSFLYDARYRAPLAANPEARAGNPFVTSSCGLVPSPPYAALLRVGFAVPPPLPGARWALTPPFHPYRVVHRRRRGGLFSVALSSRSPSPGVTRHPALWSSDFPSVTRLDRVTGDRLFRCDVATILVRGGAVEFAPAPGPATALKR